MNTCRVRVLQDRIAADVALPGGLPVGELLPALVDLVFEGAPATERARPWQLVHPVRGALGATATLDELGVVDGMTLLLEDGPPPAPPVLVGDVAEAIASALASRATDFGDRVLQWWGGALLAITGALVGAVAGRSLGVGLAAGGVALLLSLAGVILGRLEAARWTGAALAAGAIPWWGSAAASVLRPEDGHVLLAAAAAAGGAAAGAAMVTLHRSTMYAGFGAGLGLGVAGIQLALFDRTGRSDLPVAAAAVAMLVLALAALPVVTPMVGGLARLADERVLLDTLLRKVDADRRLQEWMSAGLLVALVPSVTVLARADRALADVLLLLLAVVLATRARRVPYVAEHVPLAIGSGLAAVAALVAVAVARPGAPAAAAIAVSVAIGVVTLIPRTARHRAAPQTQQLIDRIDVAAVVALLLVAAGVAGAFSGIAGLAS